MKALIGFGRCYIPSADSPSCFELKSVCVILMHQLWANSWKYTCLRMMDCLHHVTVTWKVLKGLRWKISESLMTCWSLMRFKIHENYMKLPSRKQDSPLELNSLLGPLPGFWQQ